MDFHQLADKALRSIIPERADLKAVLQAADEQLPELLSAAFQVRRHYYGKRVQIHVLQNAKSGLCPEDCHYCSQSSVSEAPIERYKFMEGFFPSYRVSDLLQRMARHAEAKALITSKASTAPRHRQSSPR